MRVCLAPERTAVANYSIPARVGYRAPMFGEMPNLNERTTSLLSGVTSLRIPPLGCLTQSILTVGPRWVFREISGLYRTFSFLPQRRPQRRGTAARNFPSEARPQGLTRQG